MRTIVTKQARLTRYQNLDCHDLYDLENDPQEMRDVSGDPKYADTLKSLQGELQRLRGVYDLPALK